MEVTTDTIPSNISIYNETTDGYSGYDRIAGCVFSVTLTIVGLIGNSHALVINVQRFQSQRRQRGVEKDPYVVFVLSLAILDMFTSLVLLPMDNADLAYRFTPYSDNMCKLFRYLQFVIHISSVLHIVLISIHCWRQVCLPKSRQINSKYAIRFCIFFDVLSATGAVIVIFLSGNKTRTIDGVTGAFCFIGESSDNPMFLRIPMTILLVGFVICLVVIISCYCALIVNRWHKRKLKSNHSMAQDEIKLQKTIVTLIIVTALFVIAYIPFMILAVIKAVDKEFQNNLSGASSAAHGIFIRFPLVNNVVNPLIYGLQDLEFRRRLLNMYPCLKSSKTQEIEIGSFPPPE